MKQATDRAARLAALRTRFLAEATAEHAELEGLLGAGPLEGPARLRFGKVVHDLRGSGGSYGFPVVSQAAAALERALRAGEDDQATLLQALATLGAALRAAEAP